VVAGLLGGRDHFQRINHDQRAAHASKRQRDGERRSLSGSRSTILVHNGGVRRDGWLMHPFYIASIKKPDEVKEPWNCHNILQAIPAGEAVQPLSQSRCPLITQSN
jgi:hypothetical protein